MKRNVCCTCNMEETNHLLFSSCTILTSSATLFKELMKMSVSEQCTSHLMKNSRSSSPLFFDFLLGRLSKWRSLASKVWVAKPEKHFYYVFLTKHYLWHLQWKRHEHNAYRAAKFDTTKKSAHGLLLVLLACFMCLFPDLFAKICCFCFLFWNTFQTGW